MQIAGVHHLAIVANDVERLAQFYETIFGFTRRPDPAIATGSVWLQIPGGPILMIEARTAEHQHNAAPAEFADKLPGYHLLAFSIHASARDDWRAHLHNAGVTIETESAYSMYVRDPEGNRLALSFYAG